MSRIEKLNSVQHAGYKVITERSASFGDNVAFMPVYPSEMRAMQSCYPLLFFKEPTEGKLYPIALFGFKDGENLFLSDEGWDAPYLPLFAQHGPMLIGFEPTEGGEEQPVMAVDMDHPRLSQDEGAALFDEDGKNTPFLDKLAQVLEAIHMGNKASDALVDTLETLELITPCTLKISLKDGSNNELSGFYMVDDEKLQSQDPAQLEPLIKSGLLFPAFMMAASMSQLQALIARKNDTLGTQSE